MNSSRASFYFVAILLIGALAFIAIQQNKIQQLTEKRAALLAEWDKPNRFIAENARLSSELKALAEQNNAEHRELLRLRGQAPALRDKEQEIARLKADRERIAQQLQNATHPTDQPAPVEEPRPELTPQQKYAVARLNFSRQIAVQLLIYADGHQEQLPTSLDAIDLKELNAMPENVAQNIQGDQFELTYKGKLNDVENASKTVIAREKVPVEGANGRWSQTYVFADGHAELSTGATREEVARRTTFTSTRPCPENSVKKICPNRIAQ